MTGTTPVLTGRWTVDAIGAVRVRPMTDDDVDDVVRAARDGADPVEVMPVDPDDPAGPDRWTAARADGFAAFLRSRLRGDGDAAGETSYLVTVDGGAAGVARLRTTPDGAAETGIWLVRSARGRGAAGTVFGRLVELARSGGAVALVADTTTGNTAALAVLRRHGAALTPRDDGSDVVDARVDLTG